MPSALATPTYRRLFAAQLVSVVGTGLATVALGLRAYDIAGGRAGQLLGTVFAIKMVAYVAVAPVAAALVHAARPRTVLVAADLVRVAAVLGLPLVTAVWQVCLLVLVLQAASAVHTPAYQAVLPRVLPDRRRYTQALALSRTADDLEMVLSPLLAAALLLVVPASGLFVGTAAGFAASALLVSRLVLTRPPAAPVDGAADGPATGFGGRVRRGVLLMARTPELRAVLALNLAVAAGGAFVLVQYVVVAHDVYATGDGGAAVLMASLGAGSVAVAALLPRALEVVPERVLMLGGGALVAVATAGLSVAVATRAGGFVAVAVLVALVGAGWAAAETPVGRIIARTTPEADQGAVFAAQFSLSHACWLVTYPLAGWLGGGGLLVAGLVLAATGAVATAVTAALWRGSRAPAVAVAG